MKNSILVLSVVLLSLSFCSCTSLKRLKTTTVTTFKVDTIIHINFDTKSIIRFAPLRDTVFVENKTAIAKSYVDEKTQRIVLELKGKPFDVPVNIQGTRTETKKEYERKGQPFYVWLFLGSVIGLTLSVIILIKTNLKDFLK